MPRKRKIVIIGSGNVAWHLAKKLSSLDEFSISIYNHRNSAELRSFEKLRNCNTFASLKSIAVDADYYIICVKDQFIATVSKKIRSIKPGSIVMHTSGSKDLDEAGKRFRERAVMYPLYSFSREADVDWKKIPIIIEAGAKPSLPKVRAFVRLLSGNIHVLNSEERLRLHLCAVLVNNFTNALYAAADELIRHSTRKDGFDFSVLLPIIRQGTEKIEKISPLKAQTGPAKRKDHTVMKQHLKLLEKNSQLKKVYTLLSKLIIGQQQSAS